VNAASASNSADDATRIWYAVCRSPRASGFTGMIQLKRGVAASTPTGFAKCSHRSRAGMV